MNSYFYPIKCGECNDANALLGQGQWATSPSTLNASGYGYIYGMGMGTWQFQLWFVTDGTVRHRQNINNAGWTAWESL